MTRQQAKDLVASLGWFSGLLAGVEPVKCVGMDSAFEVVVVKGRRRFHCSTAEAFAACVSE